MGLVKYKNCEKLIVPSCWIPGAIFANNTDITDQIGNESFNVYPLRQRDSTDQSFSEKTNHKDNRPQVARAIGNASLIPDAGLSAGLK